jgi:hypothetical protein
MAMGERNSLCERIRNAKTNLANAEQSFKENRDVRGELDLMLAEAEMKNLKKQHQNRFLWTRQLFAAACALLVLLGGYGGWLWAHARIDDGGPATAAVVTTTKPVADALPVQANTDTGQKVAPLPTKTVVTENRTASVPVASPSKTKIETTIVVPQRASNISLSTEQIHQLVRSGRQTLNSSK